MTTEADILGRKPIMKPRQEPEPEPETDWTGEHLIRKITAPRIGNKFNLSAARRKAMKRRKA